MRTRWFVWLVPVGLLGLCLYALAEEVTLTMSYPSPRGVYKDMKVVKELTVGSFRIPHAAPAGAPFSVAGAPAEEVDAGGIDLCPPGYDWYDEDLATLGGASDPSECKPTGLLVSPTGQVGIGTINPPASALLDLSSATQGLLPPRINRVSDTDPIANPAVGLLIFNTDPAVNTFEYWDGTAWKTTGGEGAPLSSTTKVKQTQACILPGLGVPCTLTASCPAGQQIVGAGRGVGIHSSGQGVGDTWYQAYEALTNGMSVAECEGQASCSISTVTMGPGGDEAYQVVLIFCQ